MFFSKEDFYSEGTLEMLLFLAPPHPVSVVQGGLKLTILNSYYIAKNDL